ncbi:hypothetical protein [Azospirillum sp.]|uniref:hypothetical protein n=1 Tax=Azospirillum sp. TaxID=34012 RepID=UPI002D733630|nr:hypothetical protein [Azospirillum sp.]HYF86154.1 hypothetical protein [Azospirillum sp.]
MMSETETVTAEAIAVRKAPLGEKRPALVDVAGFSHGIELNASMTSPFHRDN